MNPPKIVGIKGSEFEEISPENLVLRQNRNSPGVFEIDPQRPDSLTFRDRSPFNIRRARAYAHFYKANYGISPILAEAEEGILYIQDTRSGEGIPKFSDYLKQERWVEFEVHP